MIFNYWPAGLAIIIASIVAINQLISESSKFANFLGGWARRLHKRARNRYRMDNEEFDKLLQQKLDTERKRWEEDESRALNVVEGQMKYVADIAEEQQRQLNELNFQVRCMTAYTEYEATWHHRLRIMILQANNNGGHIPVENLPDHMHYTEFEKKCKEEGNMNWRRWGTV